MIKPKPEIRYVVRWKRPVMKTPSPELPWVCEDLVRLDGKHVLYGIGKTPSDAVADCNREREMLTSDIHK